ncbi:hypothetical protein FACS1894167_05590 [Synergistales bacterium]|nr:hypothetical protein FACS1894167_05590 [Synergistales bacterium]
MSIRLRLITAFFCCMCLASGIISATVFYTASKSSRDSFYLLAESQLNLIDSRIKSYFEPAMMNVQYLSKLSSVKNARGKMNSYIDIKYPSSLFDSKFAKHDKQLYDHLIHVVHANDDYRSVVMATTDGLYLEVPGSRTVSPGFDPRVTDWYAETIKDTGRVTVTTPYARRDSNLLVCVAAKVYDGNWRELGVIGIEQDAGRLLSELRSLRILNTGYIVIFDRNGKLILHADHPEYTRLAPNDYTDLVKAAINSPDGVLRGKNADGIDKHVVIRAMSLTGWRIAVVFDQSEVMNESYGLFKIIISVTVIILMMVALVVYILAGSIVSPIERLIKAASIISGDEYTDTLSNPAERSETSDARVKELLDVDSGGECIALAAALKKMIRKLKDKVDAAERATMAKSEFLSNMSHEMRTPMNAIIGMTTLAKRTSDSERKDYCLGKIENASTHLLGVINDILDMSKIEANKLELSLDDFSFEEMLQKVANVISFRVDEKHQNFSVRIDKNIPAVLIGDDQRIAQVITNLLSNAVKFTPEGGDIRLETSLIKDDGGLCEIQFDVTDSGIGISAEQRERLFKSFQQAESSTSRKFGGTGLGLVISKRIVELMDGNIWITSELGQGSKFSFTVKMKSSEKSGAGARLLDEGVNWSNIRILAVDDSANVREYFTEILGGYGLSCHTASSGEESLSLISKNGDYDVYFIDWKMPGMDGIELSRLIRSRFDAKSVVIMISAYEQSEIEAGAREAGVYKFISKPIFPSSIVDCINECLGENNIQMAENALTGEIDDFSGYCILLAEDVEINREIVISLLEPTDIEIDCAGNGAEAVRMFASSPDKYDMIFMDLQMPEVDGLEATRRIRATQVTRAAKIPIVAMTANVFREDVDKCLEAGMNDHVGKPLDFGEVLAKLRRYMIGKRG